MCNIYKEFIYGLRMNELDYPPNIQLNNNISPKLYEFLHALDDVKFRDGSYHTYCGEIKVTVNNFIYYWMETIDEVIKEADRYAHTISKDELLFLIENTINMHKTKQVDFGKEYLPVQSSLEKERYESLEKRYEEFMEGLYEFKAKVERFDKQDVIDEFAREHFEISVKKKNELFELTNTYISKCLAFYVHRIKICLEEISLRVRNNLRSLLEERDNSLNTLLHQLYGKNKERLMITRRQLRSSTDVAEVEISLAKIRERIEKYQEKVPILQLENEVNYWERRMNEFGRIEIALSKIKAEQNNVKQLEEVYKTMRTTELPGSKYTCWVNMGENFKRRKQYLEEQYLDAAKALLTFFGVRGLNRIFYKDNIGKYHMDEYGHQVYFFDHGRKMCHVTCDGTFKEVKDQDRYYYDLCGRYVLNASGERIYQCAPCTSSYKLGENNLLEKITKDCGHSEITNPECRMELKDPTDIEILPITKIIDIKGTLDPEIVNYLWKSFGHILPDALHDVFESRSKNPIHYLAHTLLWHKHGRTYDELDQKNKQAEEYRNNIYKDRQQKAVALGKTWKAKQIKRRKPEESADDQDRAVLDFYIARNDFIRSLDNFSI